MQPFSSGGTLRATALRKRVQTYTYVFGLPMWFFLSCVVGYALFVAATIIVVKCFFKNFELGPERGEEPDAAESAPAAAELKQAVETAQAVTDAAQPFVKGGEQND